MFLKLQPYVQSSIIKRANHKVSFRFFGPYKIIEKIGEVAYRLELPLDSRIHPMFHVSQLKKFIPPTTQVLRSVTFSYSHSASACAGSGSPRSSVWPEDSYARFNSLEWRYASYCYLGGPGLVDARISACSGLGTSQFTRRGDVSTTDIPGAQDSQAGPEGGRPQRVPKANPRVYGPDWVR